MEINLYEEILPLNMRKDFKIDKVEKIKNEYHIFTIENNDNYPIELRKYDPEQIVSNGFLDDLEIVHSPFNNGLVYLKVFRRRWKLKNSKISFHNNQQLHENGMKCTSELALFLKELAKRKRRKFFATFPDIRYIKEEDF